MHLLWLPVDSYMPHQTNTYDMSCALTQTEIDLREALRQRIEITSDGVLYLVFINKEICTNERQRQTK